MEEARDYSGYDLAAFTADEAFQNWVLHNKDNSYWEHVREVYPDKMVEMERARVLLLSLKFREEWPPKEIVDKYLSKALKIIDRKKRNKVVSLYRWGAVAAAVLVIAGLWTFIGERTPDRLASRQPHLQVIKDIAPGGNKAMLTLADGTQIILDSAGTGALTKEGNVTVIKMDDGQLAYQSQSSNLKPQTAVYNTISTPKGGQYQLILADGTKVWLNAESSLRFPVAFQGKERKVELTGEGYFEVTRNENAPFYVNVGTMSVRVLGTHFNVSAYTDESSIKTTLAEGSVIVNNGQTEVKLNPGQQAKFDKKDDMFRKIDNVDVSAITAWKNNEFLFNETELHEAMKQLGRWYDFEVVYESQIPPTYLYGTISRDKKLTDVLKIMEASGLKFRIEKEGTANKLIVLK